MKFFNVLKGKGSDNELLDKIEIKERPKNSETYYLMPNNDNAQESISEILNYNKIQFIQNKQGCIKCDLTIKLYNFLLSNSKKMEFSITIEEPIAWKDYLN